MSIRRNIKNKIILSNSKKKNTFGIVLRIVDLSINFDKMDTLLF